MPLCINLPVLFTVLDWRSRWPDALADAESDLRTAQSEADPRRQGQYARSAADAAAEVSLDAGASAEERERAQAIVQSALTLIPGSLLREAQSMLTAARSETDLHRRRELASSALAKAREAVRRREATDEERAQARQLMGSGRMISNTIMEASMRQQTMQPDRKHENPGVALGFIPQSLSAVRLGGPHGTFRPLLSHCRYRAHSRQRDRVHSVAVAPGDHHLPVPYASVSEIHLAAAIWPADVAALVANLDAVIGSITATVTSMVDASVTPLTGALTSAAALNDNLWDGLIRPAGANPTLGSVLIALKAASPGGLSQLAQSVDATASIIIFS